MIAWRRSGVEGFLADLREQGRSGARALWVTGGRDQGQAVGAKGGV